MNLINKPAANRLDASDKFMTEATSIVITPITWAVPDTLSINQSCLDIKIWNIFWKDQPIIECARCWTVVSGGVAKVPLRLIGSLCSSPTSTSPHPQSSSRKQVKLESSWNSFKFSPPGGYGVSKGEGNPWGIMLILLSSPAYWEIQANWTTSHTEILQKKKWTIQRWRHQNLAST